MKINPDIIEDIKGDKDLREKLAKKMKRSKYTIYRWMWGNSDNLTKADALQVISEHTGINIDLLITLS